MDLAAVDLNLLVALDLLLAERSVRAAARRAHVSASAMSHTLARLRTLFGDPLLVRAGGALVATPRAEALVAPIRDLLAQTRDLLAEATTFDPAALQRGFRVVCTDHVSTVLLDRAEQILRDEAPNAAVYVLPVTPDTMTELRLGGADVAIGVFPEATAEIRTRRLFTDGFVTVCRPEHPLACAKTLDLPAFLAARHALVAPRGTPEGHVDRLLAARGLSRRVDRTFPSFLAALLHVASHDALLTVSRRLIQATADRFPMRSFPPPLSLDDYPIVAAWHPRVERSAEDRWFRGVLLRAAADLAEEGPEGG
jgi:DNA-binding transcriptional LysR family regulator